MSLRFGTALECGLRVTGTQVALEAVSEDQGCAQVLQFSEGEEGTRKGGGKEVGRGQGPGMKDKRLSHC